VASWTPVDVSAALTTLLWDGTLAPVVVACSATLATAPTGPDRLAYFKQEAGVPESTPQRPVLELVEDSAFDWQRNARLYVAPPAAIPADRRRDRDAFDAQLAAEVARVLLATGGRALVLFTSVLSMGAVAERVAPLLPPAWRLFLQGTAPRSAILDAFNAPERPPVVAFVTRGWWEGTDIRGLDAVVIDRLPFTPPDDPLHAARRRQMEHLTGDRWAGWERVSLPEMVLALRQGVGRLLRTRADRGIVAVLDARLLTSAYGRRAVAALPPMLRARSLAELQTFSRRQP
jgi:ATP-dependent DNA helicase DinG